MFNAPETLEFNVEHTMRAGGLLLIRLHAHPGGREVRALVYSGNVLLAGGCAVDNTAPGIRSVTDDTITVPVSGNSKIRVEKTGEGLAEMRFFAGT